MLPMMLWQPEDMIALLLHALVMRLVNSTAAQPLRSPCTTRCLYVAMSMWAHARLGSVTESDVPGSYAQA